MTAYVQTMKAAPFACMGRIPFQPLTVLQAMERFKLAMMEALDEEGLWLGSVLPPVLSPLHTIDLECGMRLVAYRVNRMYSGDLPTVFVSAFIGDGTLSDSLAILLLVGLDRAALELVKGTIAEIVAGSEVRLIGEGRDWLHFTLEDRQ